MGTSLHALRVYYFASFAMFGAYLPFFPRWLEARGLMGAPLGLVVATMPAMSVLAPPLFGWVADRLQLRGSLLRVACAGAFAAFMALALASALDAAVALAPILAAVVVFSFFRAPMFMLADVVALERVAGTGASYGRLRLWGSVGFLAGALGAGEWLDPKKAAPLPVAIAIGLGCATLVAFLLPVRGRLAARPIGREVRELLGRAPYRRFLVAALLGQLGHAAYDLCYSFHLRDLGAGDGVVGAAWALGVGAEIVLLASATRLVERTSPPRMLALAFGVAAGRWVLIAVLRDVGALFAVQLLHAATFALMWLAALAHNRRAAPPAILATAQALLTASMAAGSALGMLAWGTLYRAGGGSLIFFCASGASALGALVALTIPPLARRAPRP
ncbi:MAG: MFS transporter [Myxococcales bacterium]|nr:MFS transporter [Myxococcales bacterium]